MRDFTMHMVTKNEAQAANEAVSSAGEIEILPRVAFTLALNAALSTYGVVGIASRFTGSDCTRTDPRRGLDVRVTGEEATGRAHVVVTVHIIAEYGVRVRAVTSSLQHQIQYRIERSTGFVVDAVNVHVSNLRVTNAD
jgi:uncharacterized alkaline shock family protein YloU